MHAELAAGGEPIVESMRGPFGAEAGPQANGSQVFADNVAVREYRAAYLDYWNSTKAATGTGRPVDAIISPLNHQAATRKERFRSAGKFNLSPNS